MSNQRNNQRALWDIFDNETNEFLETVHTTHEEALHCYDTFGGGITVKLHVASRRQRIE